MSLHERGRGNLAAELGQAADQRDVPARREARQRFRKRAGATDLEHLLHAAALLEHGLFPVGRRLVIDGVDGAEIGRAHV